MNMYLIAYLRTYYRIITDRRMIYKKIPKRKHGARARTARRQGRHGEGRAAMRAHDGRCRVGGKESFN